MFHIIKSEDQISGLMVEEDLSDEAIYELHFIADKFFIKKEMVLQVLNKLYYEIKYIW